MSTFYERIEARNKGAWVIHHSQKTAGTVNGPAEFPALDAAGKAAALLSQMAATSQATLNKSRVNALAKAASLSRIELPELLRILERRRLIEMSADGDVEVLGLTSRATVQHAAEIFEEQDPSPEERVSIVLAEVTSAAPMPQGQLLEFLSDEFNIATPRCRELLVQSETVGFVDAEGQNVDKLYFNGNLFRRDKCSVTSTVSITSPCAEYTIGGDDVPVLSGRRDTDDTNGGRATRRRYENAIVWRVPHQRRPAMDAPLSTPSATPETPDETIARLTAELREARDQQTDDRNPRDHQPLARGPRTVFDTIRKRRTPVGGAVRGGLLTDDGENFRGLAAAAPPGAPV